MENKKIAIVHDYLNQFGGAERVILVLHELFPKAPIYTSIFDKAGMPEEFQKMDIRTSFMQKIPGIMRFFRYWFFLYPLAFRSFNFDRYDLIISSSSAFAKNIKKGKGSLHICYCHSPARFLWDQADYIKREGLAAKASFLLKYPLSLIRMWDKKNTVGIDHFIANSKRTAKRLFEIYGRSSEVIYPPIEAGFFFAKGEEQQLDFFLAVGRLVPYKRYDIAISAFNETGEKLKIVGEGPALPYYKGIANKNIEFLGKISDKMLREFYLSCQALIFPEKSDLGLTPLEAMSCGKPVIAYNGGGASETVVNGETGILFDEQSEQALKKALLKFKLAKFNPVVIRQRALKFDKEVFKETFIKYLADRKIGL